MALLNSPVLISVAAGLLVYSAVTSFLQWKRLRHVPGPWLAPWTHLWLCRQAATGKIGVRLAETSAKYGENCTPLYLPRWMMDAVWMRCWALAQLTYP